MVETDFFQVFNYLAGSLTRIFTTLQEVDDRLILYGFVAGFALNAVMAAQMLYYWNSPGSKRTTSHKLQEPGKQVLMDGMKSSGTGMSSSSSAQTKSPSTRRRG